MGRNIGLPISGAGVSKYNSLPTKNLTLIYPIPIEYHVGRTNEGTAIVFPLPSRSIDKETTFNVEICYLDYHYKDGDKDNTVYFDYLKPFPKIDFFKRMIYFNQNFNSEINQEKNNHGYDPETVSKLIQSQFSNNFVKQLKELL